MRTLTKVSNEYLNLEGVARAWSDWGAVYGDDGCSREILISENQRKCFLDTYEGKNSYFVTSSMSAQLSKEDRAATK